MYLWLWFKMTLFSICLNYITIIMLTSTPWLFFYNINKNNFLFFYFFEQIDLVSLMTMGSLFLSKGATITLKIIYKCCG